MVEDMSARKTLFERMSEAQREVVDPLLELAARCEAAEGPDRELDAAIQRGLAGNPTEHWFENHEGDWATDASSEQYTASLDAAMTLIDENTFFHLSRFDSECDGRSEAHVYPNRFVGDDYSAEAATPALALAAAALKARATKSPSSPMNRSSE